MATIPTSEAPLQAPEARRWETFGFSGGSITGLAAVVLSIIGLAGVAAAYMAAISAIVLGAGMLLQGGVSAAAVSRLYGGTNRSTSSAVVGGGLSAEALAGIAAIVLGALSLLGVVPAILTSIAAIVLGVGLLLSCGVLSRLNTMKMESQASYTAGLEQVRVVTFDAIKATVDTEMLSAMDALVGVAAIVLGILALVGIAPDVLALVALLAIGGGIMVSGVFVNA